jgi:hypothetical protein
MTTEREFDYLAHQEDRVREASRNVAKQLRKVADDIDRAADGNLENIPSEVVSLVLWGVANAQVDSPARQYSELQKYRAHLQRQA